MSAVQPNPAQAQQRSFFHAVRRARLSVDELWLDYFALGGDAGPLEVDAYLHNLTELPPAQRDMLAHAVNERLDELAGTGRATYSRAVRDTQPRDASLAALVGLLEGAALVPPDRLAAVAATAAGVLGVGVTIYLADREQHTLHPLPAGGPERVASAGIDTTLPGRAYRLGRMLPAEGPAPRLWVPLLDGADRLGVLAVDVADGTDLYDPGLRTQCRWLAILLGHLVALARRQGDGLDHVRSRRPRPDAGELIRSLLPPLTAAAGSFVVTGVLEPRHDAGGDLFDYSLSATSASLLILDAGHDPRSGLIAATALSACRGVRRGGGDLLAQARAMDEAVSRVSGGEGGSATAVLAELDLRTGRLRYVNAGHPAPLIMRRGATGRTLSGGRRPPLGLGADGPEAGTEVLRAEDWLLLHTDGVTGARDHAWRLFGEERLVGFLRGEAHAGHPPPETARRLVEAVLAHQDGELQDDATVLLARWTGPRTTTP